MAGNELTLEEASEQQRVILSDLQNKLAEPEKHVEPDLNVDNIVRNEVPGATRKTILWVDDNPKNNSYLVAALEERGLRVDIALSTDEALAKFNKIQYDLVITDMRRPDSDKAGIDLVRRIKARGPITPIFIYCGAWAARNLRDEALRVAAAAELRHRGRRFIERFATGLTRGLGTKALCPASGNGGAPVRNKVRIGSDSCN